jgi:hypothetical protein
MKSINHSGFRKIILFLLILFLATGLIFTTNVVAQTDVDEDGLSDDVEIETGTYYDDADSDDDGIIDGQEKSWNGDADNDDIINAREWDSDNDGIFDGTEMGIDETDLHEDTDLTAGHFRIDDDNTTVTDPTNPDTDGDGILDGDEDKNHDGEYDIEEGETDPLFADTDGDTIENSIDPDDDNDGIPDWWENLHDVMDPLDASDANKDPDLDESTNLEEYLGDNGLPDDLINDDSSDPNDYEDKPNTPPKVTFRKDTKELEGGEVFLFNKDIVSVSDAEGGVLKYYWDFDGDGNNDTKAITSLDIIRTYDVGDWETRLIVVDEKGQFGVDTIIMHVIPPVGENGTIYELGPDDEPEPNKTVRKKWYIAYKLKDVQQGEEISIKITVLSGLGVRIFILGEKDFDRYVYNSPKEEGMKISNSYEEGWKGMDGLIRDADYTFTVPDEPKHGNIYVIIDNGYYQEHLSSTDEVDSPAKYNIEIERSSPMWELIIIIIAVVVVIVIIVVIAIFLGRKREKAISKKMTKEQAVETQKSLDREMARLEAEIQESLMKSGTVVPAQGMPGAPPPMAAPTSAQPQPAVPGPGPTAPPPPQPGAPPVPGPASPAAPAQPAAPAPPAPVGAPPPQQRPPVQRPPQQ